MVKKNLLICIFFFYKCFFGFAEEPFLLIDGFINNPETSSYAIICILGELDEANGLIVTRINGVPGPLSAKNRFKNSVLLLPEGKIHVVASYKLGVKGGSEICNVFDIKKETAYYLHGVVSKTKWKIDLTAFELPESILNNDRPHQLSWKERVVMTLNRNVEASFKNILNLWKDFYQTEILRAKKSFQSEEIRKKISEEYLLSKKKY